MKLLFDEIFKEIKSDESLRKRYAISNLGRFISFLEDDFSDGQVLGGTKVEGYVIFNYKTREDGKSISKYWLRFHLVGDHWVEKPSPEHVHLIHDNYYKQDDRAVNLKWVTNKEWREHTKLNPLNIAYHKIKTKEEKLLPKNIDSKARVIYSTKVMEIKTLLAKPNRKTRDKATALQFGISANHFSQIKTGKIWKHIEI